jgi:dimethylhistidine N-methyltransferase
MRNYSAVDRRRWVRPEKNAMREEVLGGLQRYPKVLSPKYFYDERGSQLFEEICKLEEYYLTRTETGILKEAIPDMLSQLPSREIDLIEPGSGSSEKTRILLEQLGWGSTYFPIDISAHFLLKSAQSLQVDFPCIKIRPVIADFSSFEPLPQIASLTSTDRPRLLFFPGSTIGNFTPVEAASLLTRFRQIVGQHGWVLVGVDLYKDVNVIERAYNDSLGVTAQFNLNILRRLNAELEANFNLNLFEHSAFFNKTQSRIEMHLRCRESCAVKISGVPVFFECGESIHTENSYKYRTHTFSDLALTSGFNVRKIYSDAQNYFGVFLMQAL